MDVVVQHAPRFDGQSAEKLARDAFGVTGRATPLASERDQNFRITTGGGDDYVLKIANATERVGHLEFENAALEHLAAHDPALGVPRIRRTASGELIVRATGPDGREHLARMLGWVSGQVLAGVVPHTEALLASIGRLVARTNRAFEGFAHPAMDREFPWDLCRTAWIESELHRHEDPARRTLIERVLDSFRGDVAPRLDGLRRRVIHDDWNDYNVLVSYGPTGAEAVSVVDFGDMVRGPVVADLAVACAYAMLGKPDPVAAAAAVVRGFHERLPLTDEERDVLLPLIRARMAISVTMAARQSEAAPGNDYLLVSQRQAWELLERLDGVSPRLALAVFRHACGLPPCAATAAVTGWLAAHRDEFAPVMGSDLTASDAGPGSLPAVVLDLSVGSLDIPTPHTVQDTQAFGTHVERLMATAGARVGVGRYDEARLVYVTDLFRHPNNWCDENRTVHLGIDLFCDAGSPVFAPIEGVVHSAANNAAKGDYGPTIVLEHVVDAGRIRFFTLYGHLSLASLADVAPGRRVAKGERLASLGDASVNGGWPPHLHFQIVVDMLGREGEFPGVAAPGERAVWLSLCPNANLIVGAPADLFPPRPAQPAEILSKRKVRVGRNLSISYNRPITMARGFAQYLYDVDGRRYLDAVNNVPHVGHCHPRVVEAAARQMGVLNTNTRYLHEALVNYADRLCALMPEGLGVCFLVCSGSEANELALRLARTYTGHRDVVVLDGAYHGNTTSLVEISPYKFDGPGGAGAPGHVHPVVMPDVFRGPFRAATAQVPSPAATHTTGGSPRGTSSPWRRRPACVAAAGRSPVTSSAGDREAGFRYAREVARTIERAEAAGRNVAAFICESLLGCGGQIVLPDGYLEHAYAAVRSAGGVAIADEVQVGFGRVGTHVWGFETQGVVPDIVTLGKPIGNGFPLGAVVTRPEIADAFANGMEYFNTFGGTQAACAAGLAVLDVMRDEGLQAHALQVGSRLKVALSSLASEFPIVGDVRGLGLFLGIELVDDRTTLAPAARQADYVVNRLRDRGVLVSTDGPLHNVLKLKPPMPFSASDADRVVELLRRTLAEDPAQPV